jgi:hypothetical protein
MASLSGYFCIITSDRMTAREGLLLYKSRNSSEKLFSADKTFTGSRAERVQTEQALRSKVFIEFIALIIRSLVYGRICEHTDAVGIRRNYMNVTSVISKLEKIEMVRTGDGVYRIDHAITARQKDILSVFGMSADDMKDACLRLSNALVDIDTRDVRKKPDDSDIRNDSTIEDKAKKECQD